MGAVFLNILSAVFNIFSFTLLIPILQILFEMDSKVYEFMPWDSTGSLKDIAVNNFYYYVSHMIEVNGPSMTLLFLGLFLAFMTLLKTACYFASSAVMIPLRTGVVRDIRIMVYSKVMSLPLGFFSEERKGDIIARMSGDVGEVENSITSSLDMLIKNPILIIFYFGTLIITSWQLTLFTLLVLPGMGWLMGVVGKKLKRQSLEAQGKWSDTMSQLEETLGGLRIIKAFIAEKRMVDRFAKCSNELRDANNRVAMRQALAHPMSEFLGTILIVIVLWFGGSLILGKNSTIDAPSFIFYMVILYSVINPLKEFSKAGYNIPKGLASMERVDKILKAENNIKEIPNPKPLNGLNDKIEFKDISFSYNGKKEVLKHVNLTVPKGKTIALVGQSGSGKSTLVDLLPRYHDVQEGEITIDGTSIKDVRISALRTLIGNVNQEAILFNDSFFNNIAFGVENATMEQVIEAAKIANAHDFIMEKDKMLHPGDVFTDKDRKYQVIAVAYHAKSNEKMIVYQQLFDNFKILTDTFDDFFNQPEAEVHIEIPADDRKDNDADTKEDLKGVNPVLMGFFDRDTCTDKIEYIAQVRDKLDDRLVSDIAASMDITIEEGSLDDKIDSLLICLRTKAKYECNRFR